MANLTIRNLPDELYASLKERAKRNRRSLNQEVIAELAAGWPGGDALARMRRVEEESAAIRGRAKVFMSAEEIDAARTEGRA